MNLPEDFLSSHAELHIDDNQQCIIITDDNDARMKLKQLNDSLKNISKGIHPPFIIMPNRISYKQHACAVQLLNTFRLLGMMPQEYLQMRVFNPRITVFQKLFNKADLKDRVYNGNITNIDPVTTAEMLNKLAQDYRSAVSESAYKQQCRKYKRASVKNLKGVLNYIRYLQSRYTRLLVLRVDLSWASEYKSEITADTARKYRQRLFLNMKKNPLFRHVLGTVWKLEYGPQRKFHYHVLFFLNGKHAQQDVNIARAFGEYWKTTITEGKGIYYNCNAHKERYEKCGLGKVQRDDTAAQEGLLEAVKYMTKIDACARLVLPRNARTFGRGEVKALNDKKRLLKP
jgi:hypothetical protein